jgi:hypothetical protein
MMTPRSLSISAASNDTLCAQSSRMSSARSTTSGFSVGTWKHVHGLVEAREGIDARAEPHADRLHERHDVALREVLRPVERHVLHEMRQSLLVIVFHQRADVDDEAKLGALFGQPVPADVVLQAVRERPGCHLRIDRQLLGQLGR